MREDVHNKNVIKRLKDENRIEGERMYYITALLNESVEERNGNNNSTENFKRTNEQSKQFYWALITVSICAIIPQ